MKKAMIIDTKEMKKWMDGQHSKAEYASHLNDFNAFVSPVMINCIITILKVWVFRVVWVLQMTMWILDLLLILSIKANCSYHKLYFSFHILVCLEEQVM